MLTAIVRDERTGGVVGVLVLQPKTFKSGKSGFFGQAKLEIAGKRYQAQAQLVAIGEVAREGEVASDGELEHTD